MNLMEEQKKTYLIVEATLKDACLMCVEYFLEMTVFPTYYFMGVIQNKWRIPSFEKQYMSLSKVKQASLLDDIL